MVINLVNTTSAHITAILRQGIHRFREALLRVVSQGHSPGRGNYGFLRDTIRRCGRPSIRALRLEFSAARTQMVSFSGHYDLAASFHNLQESLVSRIREPAGVMLARTSLGERCTMR